IPVHPRPPLGSGRPAGSVFLEPEVVGVEPPIVLRGVVPAGVGDDLLAVEAADPGRGLEPDHALVILDDPPDLIVAKVVVHGEVRVALAIEAADTLLPGPEPIVALAVFENGAHPMLETEPSRSAGDGLTREGTLCRVLARAQTEQ